MLQRIVIIIGLIVSIIKHNNLINEVDRLFAIANCVYNNVEFFKPKQMIDTTDNELLETQLYNKVLINRIENCREEIRILKAKNHNQKQIIETLNKQNQINFLRDTFAIFGAIGVVFLVGFLISQLFL